MKCLKSFFRFSTKIVKLDIDSILSGEATKSKSKKTVNLFRCEYDQHALLLPNFKKTLRAEFCQPGKLHRGQVR